MLEDAQRRKVEWDTIRTVDIGLYLQHGSELP